MPLAKGRKTSSTLMDRAGFGKQTVQILGSRGASQQQPIARACFGVASTGQSLVRASGGGGADRRGRERRHGQYDVARTAAPRTFIRGRATGEGGAGWRTQRDPSLLPVRRSLGRDPRRTQADKRRGRAGGRGVWPWSRTCEGRA